ncbi:MAG: hypothetical protein L0H96_06810 [Humibacillus sp.]|nr:hypothetical protein [Humibacillus sp.]MDN5776603.1 hypothetical protein [Humibacillus sp.]
MTRYCADSVMGELTDFQRRSVDHVVEQLYGVGSDRFLVADETGLGKSMVARGVIARAIEHLQDEPSVKRIDVVYVCANADLAQQNLGRLNVTEDETISFSSRLTLLGKHSTRLKKRRSGSKPVNLVSFTPGTSFDLGHSTGTAEERAMLFLALRQCLDLSGYRRTAGLRLLQGNVRRLETFRSTVSNLEESMGDAGIDMLILRQFRASVRRGGARGLLGRFELLVDEMGRKHSVPESLRAEQGQLVRDLRNALATASVETLEPDLVILDEFQRFRHLLDPGHEAGQLADQLFTHPDAKVLLLSATPYKPYTYAEERDDNHAEDFYFTLEFLAKGRDSIDVERVRTALSDYRSTVVNGGDPGGTATTIRSDLLKVMSRQERPRGSVESMMRERIHPADTVTAADLLGYVDLQNAADHVALKGDRGLVTPEYWKSAPYFINFCDGYQLGSRVRTGPLGLEALEALARTQRLRSADVERFQQQDAGNARMRDLVDSTVGKGLWKLLWVPPSLPYLQPSGPYAEVTDVTKMVVFSSWTATPTAVASLLSYEAERLAARGTNYRSYSPEGRHRLSTPLSYSVSRGRPAQMSTFTLFWPMPTLAVAVDPLGMVANSGGVPIGCDEATHLAMTAVRSLLDAAPAQEQNEEAGELPSNSGEEVWQAAFGSTCGWPPGMSDEDLEEAPKWLGGGNTDEHARETEHDGVVRHLGAALTFREMASPPVTDEALETLAEVALHSPANSSYRALSRILTADDDVSDADHFQGSVIVANGLRSLFNRPDVTKIVEQTTTARRPYWQRVLAYCAAGNLQSVLDEYLHHLRTDQFKAPLTTETFLKLARRAAEAASLRTTTYQAIDVDDLEGHLRFVPRFAVRYGGRKQNAEDARQPEVRASFNSPFWPFVLASTSVGQEGIDFHWWCHSVFHWNTPANPVDFEQREGRVDRYRGHAVRRNIAARHDRSILAKPGRDPWATAFAMATEYQHELGDFSPSWVYPGPAKIERHVAPFALSSDEERFRKVKQDVALYRLAFGQPRQEDMIELLRRRGLDADPDRLGRLRISLAPGLPTTSTPRDRT